MSMASEWLNYHHLYYFWVVAHEGSIVRACTRLRLAQPTVSAQLQELEAALGEALFLREGRRLVLTDTGRHVLGYADEIFSLGRELLGSLHGRGGPRPRRFEVGISDALPKLVAYRLLEPALHLAEPVHLVCREDRAERLLAELSVHGLDLVLSEQPILPSLQVKAYNHLLGESSVSIVGTATLAARHRLDFPRGLDGAPFLLPLADTVLRRALSEWFESVGVRPEVVAEFQDSATLKAFGQAGLGLFAVPTAVETEVRRQYRVDVLGRVESVRERFYAISLERRIKHPAVAAISASARQTLGGGGAATDD
ncbi:MAG TPA: LysR family transcriptional regulator [Polyangia bacterium]|jgi:LysR family transcriptional activator of nhaA|nr:LysR family transcriptional regulator [Polyangia bacterium]